MSVYEHLRPIFYPRSVAIVGVSQSNSSHLSQVFFKALIGFDFKGQLYLVNPRGGEIEGRKVYPSLADIPGDVEYVISLVAAREAPNLLKNCIRKGVKAVHFFTAGFAETGGQEGIKLEAEIAVLARQNGIRVAGPNCMGVYCPESRLSFNSMFPKESGKVGLITQSGSYAMKLITHAAWRGVRFSKAISFGNACDLNETDFLEYLAEDPQTSIITMYLEGVKDGRRFLRALKKAASEKIVILLKGGVTAGGAEATMGHTGSLAGSEQTWDALCKQYGVIRVNTIEEITDVLVTLLFFPLPKGRNTILLGGGGGTSVMITDQFEKNGLRVPPLPQDIKDLICSFTPVAGNILRNPIDYGQIMLDTDKLMKTVNIVMDWKGSDFLVTFFHVQMYSLQNETFYPLIMKEIHEAAARHNKPTAIIQEPTMPHEDAILFPTIQNIAAMKIPVYQSYEGASRGIDLVLKHFHI